MVHIPRLSRLAVAAAVVAIVSALAPTVAEGQTVQQLSPGQATTLDAAGVYLPPPTDGRLSSYGVAVHVAGVAFGSQAGVSPPVAAAPGAELVVLHVVTSWDLGDVDSSVLFNKPVILALQSGTLAAPLQVQNSYPSPADQFYAVAVAKGAPAVLTLSVGGLVPQSLDLRTDRRIGTAPPALYRAGFQPAVDVKPPGVASFSASTGAGTATGQFGVSEAFLAYWQPFSTTMASSPADGYLDVEFARSQLTVAGYDSSSISPTEALPAGSVKFQLPGGQTVPATVRSDPTQLFDIFSGDFYAQVPADVTSVKVIVTPGALPIQVPSSDGTDQNVNLTFTTPLTATVDLPPPWTPSAESGSSHAPAANPSVASRPARHHGGSDTAIVSGIVAALVIVLGLLALVARRRRVLVPICPLGWPPAGLGPAATEALAAGRRRALPAASTDAADSSPGRNELGAVPAAAVNENGSGGRAGPAVPKLIVRVLGPLEVDGLAKPIRRQSVRRLLVVLAVTPERPMGADELAMAISDHPDRDPKAASLHSYASILRSSLPAGLLPDAATDGYRLDHAAIAVDWLALSAAAAQEPDSAGWAERAAGALELVRGQPLTGGSWEGIEPAIRSMQATIEHLARNLAARLIGEGNPARAEWAAAKGLAAVPGSVGLWQDRLDAATAGSGYGLERAWTDARTALGADAALLSARYQHLRQTVADRPAANT
jgi:hypothetical protein